MPNLMKIKVPLIKFEKRTKIKVNVKAVSSIETAYFKKEWQS